MVIDLSRVVSEISERACCRNRARASRRYLVEELNETSKQMISRAGRRASASSGTSAKSPHDISDSERNCDSCVGASLDVFSARFDDIDRGLPGGIHFVGSPLCSCIGTFRHAVYGFVNRSPRGRYGVTGFCREAVSGRPRLIRGFVNR